LENFDFCSLARPIQHIQNSRLPELMHLFDDFRDNLIGLL